MPRRSPRDSKTWGNFYELMALLTTAWPAQWNCQKRNPQQAIDQSPALNNSHSRKKSRSHFILYICRTLSPWGNNNNAPAWDVRAALPAAWSANGYTFLISAGSPLMLRAAYYLAAHASKRRSRPRKLLLIRAFNKCIGAADAQILSRRAPRIILNETFSREGAGGWLWNYKPCWTF